MRGGAPAAGHPHIVPLYSVGEFAGHPYIEIEYLAGGSLAGAGHAPAADISVTAKRLATLARAVHHAHTHGIVHRDLKPGNILVASDGTLKVSDFGLAHFDQFGAALTPTTVILGTPGYMAPELISGRGRLVGPQADVYGLGAVAYYWLTGRPPYDGTTPYATLLMAQAGDPIPLRRRRHDVPTDLETIVMKCLDLDPRCRYHSAEELADDR